ncbi:hypothetical protein C8Q74DRAFT_1251049, partial [Fomes fomentarius]
MPHAPSATSTSGYRVPRTPHASPRQAPSLAPALSSTTRSTRRPPWHLRRAPSLMQQSSAISSETVFNGQCNCMQTHVCCAPTRILACIHNTAIAHARM